MANLWIVAVAVGLLLLFGLSLALLQIRTLKKQHKSAQKALEERAEKQELDLSAILDANHGMGNRLNELQQELKELKEKQQQLEQRDLGALPYNEAVRLVANGATADQLVDQCGLSRSEADLVLLLHKSSPPVVEPLSADELIRTSPVAQSQEIEDQVAERGESEHEEGKIAQAGLGTDADAVAPTEAIDGAELGDQTVVSETRSAGEPANLGPEQSEQDISDRADNVAQESDHSENDRNLMASSIERAGDN